MVMKSTVHRSIKLAKQCKTVLMPNIASKLDHTITSVQKVAMIIVSVIDEAGRSSKSLPSQKVVCIAIVNIFISCQHRISNITLQ